MTNHLYRLALTACSPLLFASACTNTASLGISASEDLALRSPQKPASSAPIVLDEVTTLLPPAGRKFVNSAVARVGDVDGDGLDDFFLSGYDQSADTWPEVDVVAYLFYGRAELPPQLAATDADATFEGTWQMNFPLGDINGDQRADFAIGHMDSFEVVFGTAQRFAGDYPAGSAQGLTWHLGPLLPGGLNRIREMGPLGDVNGDGCDDFLVLLNLEDTWERHLVLGRRDGWPTGQWDSSFSAYPLDAEDQSAGDLNGDGYTDLLLTDNDWVASIHYGGPDRADGTLAVRQSSARIRLPDLWLGYIYIASDVDGDGHHDFVWKNEGESELHVMYGTPARLAGEIDLVADLSIRGPNIGLISDNDVNGDGLTDLTFEAWLFDENGEVVREDSGVYTVLGTGKRLTGRYELQDDQRIEALSGRPANLQPLGDVDGDGREDAFLDLDLDRALLYQGATVDLF